MPIFSSLNGEVASRLGGIIGFTYLFQTAFAAVAVPLQTERFYDFAGSLGFISSTILSSFYPNFRLMFNNARQFGLTSGRVAEGLRGEMWVPWKVMSVRQMVISSMVLIWAGRLGSFLVKRISKEGKDSRFDEIKKNPLLFSGAWLGQATWVTLSGLPVWLINAVPAAKQARFGGVLDLVGVGIWAGAFGLEILADRQKSAWRQAKNDKKHDEPFIKSGLWGWSRHPNYAGEITLWAGPSLLALPTVLAAAHTSNPLSTRLPSYFPYLLAIPCVFEYFLLTKASGVPLLEESGDKKYGHLKEWREYKEKVPVLFAWPGKKV